MTRVKLYFVSGEEASTVIEEDSFEEAVNSFFSKDVWLGGNKVAIKTGNVEYMVEENED